MNDQVLSIKAKKMGVRLAAYRQARGFSLATVSKWAGIDISELEKVESGESSLSMPILEWIAVKMGIPADQLIEGDLNQVQSTEVDPVLRDQFTTLRDKMIALILKKTRLEQNKSLEETAKKCGFSVNILEGYESGAAPIPWPELESLLEEYGIAVTSLFSPSHADEDVVLNPRESVDKSQDEMVDFVRNPANQAYLELAKKLSEMDASKLRTIAETILEITY